MEIAFLTSQSTLSARDLAFQILAVDVQMRRDFAPLWKMEPWPCVPYAVLPDQKDLFHPIFVMDNIGAPDALGFHDDILNFIYGRVITPPNLQDASTASHEAVEMRADPDCSRFAPMGDGREVAVETGDPVEADAYPITVKIGNEARDILVSNFVLPAYFVPGSAGPWDFLGRLSGPAPAMTPGGYLIVRDPGSGELSNVFSNHVAASRLAAKAADPHSRAGRRIAKHSR